MALHLTSSVLELPGVGEVRAKKLEKLGLRRIMDLLSFYPRDYEDRRQRYTVWDAPLGRRVCVLATVTEAPHRVLVRRGLQLIQIKAADQTGTLNITFFNQSYVEKTIYPGNEYIFYGVVEAQGNRRCMSNPLYESPNKPSFTGRIVPIYPLTAGISNHMLYSYMQQALTCTHELPESLPQSVRQAHELAAVEFAVQNIHFPASEEALELAKRRLTFEELFYLSVGLTFLKFRRDMVTQGTSLLPQPIQEFLALLPFTPTDAQRRVMEEISADVCSGRPMNRLVQGDVGSGKTIVAAFAAWLCTKSGFQAAMMAPTEVLAEQHYRSLSPLLGQAGIRVGLLTGSMSAAEKRQMQNALSLGEIDFVIGTHALISDRVAFQKLALMIADEQHRFGVAQRSALAAKSETGGMPPPHVLVMSATPIPRTLALIVYGDLDVSIIDQLPPGRTPIETYVVHEDKRQRMYGFVRKQVAAGRQVYLICPAVDETEDSDTSDTASDLKAVKSYAAKLQEEVFPDLTIGILHGKMKPKEKDSIMAAFSDGTLNLLVATTVVEVGVDVPNANLIIIENADRFGLSQLHQLRGRVGRGQHQSYCVLVTSSHNPDTMHRLRTLASTTDGFQIAEEDLKLRGPGDFFGNRQHGMPQMKLASLTGDMRLLKETQQAAAALLESDPTLSKPEHYPVLEHIRHLFAETPDIFN